MMMMMTMMTMMTMITMMMTMTIMMTMMMMMMMMMTTQVKLGGCKVGLTIHHFGSVTEQGSLYKCCACQWLSSPTRASCLRNLDGGAI